MQINKTILMLAVVMLLSPIFSLYAVETTTTTKIDPAKLEAFKAKLKLETATIKTNLNNSKTDIESKLLAQKNEVKVRLVAKSQEKIKDIIEKIYNKFNEQTGKLSQVDIKMSAKIAGLEKDGADVSKIKAQYAIAKASLNKTTSEIFTSRAVSVEQVSKEISKSTIRTLVKAEEESIKTTGNEYRKLLPMISPTNEKEKVETKTKDIKTN